jgi:hypothetical protein
MRSTNIIIFLICLNAAAAVVSAGLGSQLGVEPQVGGDATIERAGSDVTDATENPSAGALSGTLLGFVSAAGSVITAIDQIIFMGPNMFVNLGAPSILINPFKIVLIFIFGFDVAEVLSGRILS